MTNLWPSCWVQKYLKSTQWNLSRSTNIVAKIRLRIPGKGCECVPDEISLCNVKEANGDKGSVHVHSSVCHSDVLEADNQ